MEALAVVSKAADLETLGTTPNAWFYDSDTKLVYYHPAEGEDLEDIHLELSQNRTSPTTASEQEGTLRPAAASIEMRNLNLLFSNRYGYYPGGAYEGLVLERVDSSYAGISAYSPNGGSETTASYCVGRYTFDEDIFTVTGAGTRFTGSWCLAEYAWDDGFQATPGSTMTLDHCIARFNGMEEGADNTGFSAEGENITCGLYNCVAYANYGRGISHGATGTGGVTVKNCISYATVYSATYDAHIGASPSEFVHTNNIFGGKAVAWELDETESLADPLFVDPPYDLHLQAGSPAIDAGVAIEGITDGYLGDAPDIGVFEKA